jgi:ferric-dicitrate binding protein FerR (iron transport regulator)
MVQTINSDRLKHAEIVEILYPVEIQSRVTLSDGSIVTLKDGSRLIQKNNFSGNTREIMLEGEAFFDIAHNPNRPFIIHTGRIRTTVLGTSFSIAAIPGETSMTVAVAEGKVKIEDGGELLAILQANQQFTYGIELEHSQESLAEIKADWHFLELIFRNMSFGDIAQQLAIKYGVTIVFRDEELKQRSISVLLDSRNSIEELLIFLSASQGATVTAEQGNYVIKSTR